MLIPPKLKTTFAELFEVYAPINGLPQDGGGGAGNPREFGIVKFSQGSDFDIKNGMLIEKFKWT